MKGGIFTIISLKLLLSNSYCVRGDTKPFCYSPEKYPGTLTPTPSIVDLQKFKGTWHEMARIGGYFEGKRSWLPKVEFTLEKDQYNKDILRVRDSCQIQGMENAVVYDTYCVNKPYNTKFKVRNQNVVNGNYWILDIDTNGYQWVVIGEPCRDNLWIYTRSNKMNLSLVRGWLRRRRML